MTASIAFYFDFISPYSYLAHTQLPRIAACYGRNIAYHPVDLTALKLQGGNTGPASREQPLKFKYNYADFARWSARYGVPMKRLGGYDPKCRLTRGTFYAADRGQAGDYVTATWTRIWGQGGSLADEALMRDVAREMGWNADEFLTFLDSAEADRRFTAETKAAHAAGVFGVPTMTIGDELWWGNDRLDFLEDYLKVESGAGEIRRVVTGHDASGKAVVAFDGDTPHTHRAPNNGPTSRGMWVTDAVPARADEAADPWDPKLGIPPPKGGTIFTVVDFPPTGDPPPGVPNGVIQSHLGPEHMSPKARAPRHPFMHRTRTVDYGIVLSGEIDMLLDDAEVHFKAGDVVIQRATNHAWVNRGTVPCRIAFILVDAVEPLK